MAAHIGNVESGLTVRAEPEPDPLQGLRDALQSPQPPTLSHSGKPKRGTSQRR
jgi:hypothetical protein